MTYQTELDLRELALIIARVHDLTLTAMKSAYEVSENDDEFLTAICASADLQEVAYDLAR